MKSARDQDVATGVISLGLLANRLAWYLLGGNEELPALKVDNKIFDQWKDVLRETIDFIKTTETGEKANKTGAVPRFLSHAQYLEQIYDAAPIQKKDMKEFAEYLEKIFKHLEKLEIGKKIDDEALENLLIFSKSIADQSIQEAARYNQESHIRISLETLEEITTSA